MAAATQIKSSKKNWRNTEASFVKLPEQSMPRRVENFSPGWLSQGHEVCFFYSPTLRLISKYSMIQKLKSRSLSL